MSLFWFVWTSLFWLEILIISDTLSEASSNRIASKGQRIAGVVLGIILFLTAMIIEMIKL